MKDIIEILSRKDLTIAQKAELIEISAANEHANLILDYERTNRMITLNNALKQIGVPIHAGFIDLAVSAGSNHISNKHDIADFRKACNNSGKGESSGYPADTYTFPREWIINECRIYISKELKKMCEIADLFE